MAKHLGSSTTSLQLSWPPPPYPERTWAAPPTFPQKLSLPKAFLLHQEKHHLGPRSLNLLQARYPGTKWWCWKKNSFCLKEVHINHGTAKCWNNVKILRRCFSGYLIWSKCLISLFSGGRYIPPCSPACPRVPPLPAHGTWPWNRWTRPATRAPTFVLSDSKYLSRNNTRTVPDSSAQVQEEEDQKTI